MRKHTVICDYCDKPAMLVTGARIYPENPRVHSKHFWFCGGCEAWIGCHENSPVHKPVGRMADKALRKAKREFHAAFDILWLAGFERLSRVSGSTVMKHECRSTGYKWLADKMGIEISGCNPGQFDLAQAYQAKQISEMFGTELLARYTTEVVGDE